MALGHREAEYDAWLIDIGNGDQFGSGFVDVNPNSKIPALVDRGGATSIRVFESGAILVYLAEKFGAFLPVERGARAEGLSWLFWQVGSAPYLGGGTPEIIEQEKRRIATQRQLDEATGSAGSIETSSRPVIEESQEEPPPGEPRH